MALERSGELAALAFPERSVTGFRSFSARTPTHLVRACARLHAARVVAIDGERLWLRVKLGPRSSYALRAATLMAVFYAALYHPWAADSLPGRALLSYLELTARASAWALELLGEQVTRSGIQVSGRFAYIVVLDCAALDAQSLYVAAVLAFPVRPRYRLIGLCLGLIATTLLNVARLVILYYAGIHSIELFHVLHEEVMVFALIAIVCLLFVVWVRWATPLNLVEHADAT